MITPAKSFVLGIITVIALSTFPNAYAATFIGSSCSKVGQTALIKGQKLTCSLTWVGSGTASKISHAPKSSTASSGGIQRSKGFALISIQFNNSSVIPGASARIQNISNASLNATFAITIFATDGITPQATLNGTALSVVSGETQTVQFITTSGTMPTGQFKYAFQTSVQF